MLSTYIERRPKSKGRFNSRGVFILGDRHAPRGSGGSASYYKLTNAIGIKVHEADGPWKSVQTLRKSPIWKKAKDEMNMLNTAKKRIRRVPRVYKYVPVKYGRQYTVGIIMQHIDCVTLKRNRQIWTTKNNIIYNIN